MTTIRLVFDTSGVDIAIKELMQELQRDIRSCMPKLQKEAEKILKRNIQERYYKSGNFIGGSLHYHNTGSVAHAFQAKISGDSLIIFMDESRIHAHGPSGIMLGAYVGFARKGVRDGMRQVDFRSQMLEGINEGGIAPSVINKKGYSATGYFNYAFQEMEDEIPKLLANLLRGKGWDVSIS